MHTKLHSYIKPVLIVLFAGIVIFLCIRYAVPFCRLLVTEQGRELICQKVESFGIFAPLIFILLAAVQIVIAFIPGGPLELVGGILFGSAWGLLYTTAGVFLGTLTVYSLVKKFGRPLVEVFVSEKHMKHFQFLEDEQKLEFWVFLLFLIPGIPKDLLTYIIPLTKMDGKHFLLLSMLARFPSLAASVLVGDSLSDGRYWLCIVICAIAAVGTFIGYQVRQHITKTHKAYQEKEYKEFEE